MCLLDRDMGGRQADPAREQHANRQFVHDPAPGFDVQAFLNILAPLTALMRLSLAPVALPSVLTSSIGTRLPDSLCQLSQLVGLELRGNR